MRIMRTLALTGVLALAGAGCADLEVTNLNQPDRQRAISTPGDVESLIVGSMNTWWNMSYTSWEPIMTFTTMADETSSSWGNFGMKDLSSEPRAAFINTPSYGERDVATDPWNRNYRTLAAVRDGLIAIEGGVEIGTDGQDTERAVAFGKMMQGLALGTLAQVFDQAFIVDESTDLEEASLVPYDEVWAAALTKLNEAESMAMSGNVTIPADWIGFARTWDGAFMARFIKSMRARLMTQVPKNVAERDAVNWNQVLTDVNAALESDEEVWTTDFQGDGPWFHNGQFLGLLSTWTRLDNRYLGPGDVSGEWENWIGTLNAGNYSDAAPFDITTPDSRITEPMSPQTHGKYVQYRGSSPFVLSRGIYHFSNYQDQRHVVPNFNSGGFGVYTIYPRAELEFLKAEALFRTGDLAGAMEIVNDWRAVGDLPPFTDPNGVAPGGTDMCVPQNEDGSCGDLWEALKYEKRMEIYQYGMGTAMFDDRGWGDLVTGTAIMLPVPAEELQLLLMDLYTFGGDQGGAAPNIVNGFSPEALRYHEEVVQKEGVMALLNDTSPEALRYKREVMEAWNEKETPRGPGAVVEVQR